MIFIFKKLANMYLGVTMPKAKKLFMINWDKIEVPLESVKYAARDARIGSALFHEMVRPPKCERSLEDIKEEKKRSMRLKNFDGDIVKSR
ncbi:hypothetical protein HK096_006465, partial [Nowakowskiella sp. JEL0078]